MIFHACKNCPNFENRKNSDEVRQLHTFSCSFDGIIPIIGVGHVMVQNCVCVLEIMSRGLMLHKGLKERKTKKRGESLQTHCVVNVNPKLFKKISLIHLLCICIYSGHSVLINTKKMVTFTNSAFIFSEQFF